MKKLLLFFLVLAASPFFLLSQNPGDSCLLSLGGKRGGVLSAEELKNLKGLQYADTLNCDYRLKEAEFIIKDMMGIDIITQTSPLFLSDMKSAITRMEKGTRLTINITIWKDKARSGTYTQTLKFEVK